MNRTCFLAAVVAAVTLNSGLMAQPEIISLGNGSPGAVTPSVGGTNFIGGSGPNGLLGAGRWSLTGTSLIGMNFGGTAGRAMSSDGAFLATTVLNTGPQISGNSAANVNPPFSMDPVLTPVPLAVTEGRGARLEASTGTFQNMGGLPIVPSLMVYGSGSSGSSTGNFISPHAISQNGRFTVGLGYISTYNSAAGTTISANTFQWRPWIWDADANAGAGGYTVLPTPFRTSTNTWRRRTGNAYAVSNDGLVIVGAQEHNAAVGPAADPDGSRPVVWRWDAGLGEYVMTFLPNGVDANGFPITISSTPGQFHINAAGTLIVGIAVDTTGPFIAKWNWDAGSSTWSAPVNIGNNLAAQASWLPGAVTDCNLPPRLIPTGMSDDGNTIIGIATYSTCGSFMAGGWIWTASSGVISDWYDHLSENAGATIAANYGPIGDNGDPSRGLPRLGAPFAISTDGNAIVGGQTGNQIVAGAPPWIVLNTGGPGCVPPSITFSPTATINISACTSSIILNVGASGTLPITFQWQKNGVDAVDGTTPSGSIITGAATFQMRVNPLLSPADVGLYAATATGVCGSPAISATSVVQLDPAHATPANDVCAGAQTVAAGTNVLAPAQGLCGAFTNDPISAASCSSAGTKADRWFVFTPVTTGNYRLETCGANFDTVLSVFPDCTSGSELACNDNYTFGPSAGCNAARSRIDIFMIENTPYYIRIAAPLNAFISDTSTMNLSINSAPTPAANDNCADATAAVIGTNALDTTEATSDGSGSCSPAGAFRDVWFTYTPSAAGFLRAATCPGTTWNTVLTVFTDGCLGNEIACNDNAGVSGCFNQSIVENLRVAAGTTYHIRVGGNSATAFGTGTLTLGFICLADFNSNGIADSQDFFDFIVAFFNGTIDADINGDTIVNSQDFFDFLTVFFAGC